MSVHVDWRKLLCGSLVQSLTISESEFWDTAISISSNLSWFFCSLIFPLQKGGEISVIGHCWNCKFDAYIPFLLPVFLTDEDELYPTFLREQDPWWWFSACSLSLE